MSTTAAVNVSGGILNDFRSRFRTYLKRRCGLSAVRFSSCNSQKIYIWEVCSPSYRRVQARRVRPWRRRLMFSRRVQARRVRPWRRRLMFSRRVQARRVRPWRRRLMSGRTCSSETFPIKKYICSMQLLLLSTHNVIAS